MGRRAVRAGGPCRNQSVKGVGRGTSPEDSYARERLSDAAREARLARVSRLLAEVVYSESRLDAAHCDEAEEGPQGDEKGQVESADGIRVVIRTKELNSGPVGGGAVHPAGMATVKPVMGMLTGLPS
jgi:hypothetical protein